MRRGPEITEEQDEILDWLDDGFSRTENVTLTFRLADYSFAQAVTATHDGFLVTPPFPDGMPDFGYFVSVHELREELCRSTVREVEDGPQDSHSDAQNRFEIAYAVGGQLIPWAIAAGLAFLITRWLERQDFPLPEWIAEDLFVWVMLPMLLALFGLAQLIAKPIREALTNKKIARDDLEFRTKSILSQGRTRSFTARQYDTIADAVFDRNFRVSHALERLDSPRKPTSSGGLLPSRKKGYPRVFGPFSHTLRAVMAPNAPSLLAPREKFEGGGLMAQLLWLGALAALLLLFPMETADEEESLGENLRYIALVVGSCIPPMLIAGPGLLARRAIQRRRKAKIAARHARLVAAANLVLNGESPVGHRFGPSLRWLERMRAFV
ncbi:hypothetical protein HK107_00435 [Parvularcula sp. ZS-1/3]|uniref:Uncharacterized protein n=1 Tax=Parvularcula mediterranea TaxID=2732508 RepID=A0A7Y3RK04_9PROT|nr:hypothetical protein [Parvularcula mediterranea]NNU14787.1 hypothetical protein [Parvularcula mediterranea]